MTALAWRLLVADPLLLSGLGVAWFAGGVALSAQREVLPSTERGGRWGGAFAVGAGSALTVRVVETA